MQSNNFDIIVAINDDSLIGIKECGKYTLPWSMIREDMQFFRIKTTSTEFDNQVNAIIMGYNTWTSMPEIYKKNKKRLNIIIGRNSKESNNNKQYQNSHYVESFEDALTYIDNFNLEYINKIYVVGGSVIYGLALSHNRLGSIYITHINHKYPLENIVDSKIYFPITLSSLNKLVENNMLKLINESSVKYEEMYNIGFRFLEFKVIDQYYYKVINLLKIKTIIPYDYAVVRNNYDENQYMDMIKHIMENGIDKETRNAITRSVFGYQLRYDLSKGFPILTTKRVPWKGLVEELLWIMSGSTDVSVLRAKGVKIWDKNSTIEYLRKYGLPYEADDIGSGYGFQMRYTGAKYINCKTNYKGQGVDQLQNCIYLIKNDPYNRRIIIDLWDVPNIDNMALPPCHLLYQFTVDPSNEKNGKSKLNCHLFQRSWDTFLGWNTSTAALLTLILAKHCDLEPGTVLHSITDVHIYKPHIDEGHINELLSRIPRSPPKVYIKTKHNDIDDYKFEDFVIEGYHPYPAIVAEMFE
jgi:dihydrofolate reductase/thymidylate synthase